MNTLTQIMNANRDGPGRITFFESGQGERTIDCEHLYTNALRVLGILQSRGMRRGDELILLLDDNEQFLYGFWAAVLGGIVAVPVTAGVADEHAQKLLRIASRLRNAFVYTDHQALSRVGVVAERAGIAEQFDRLRSRAFLVDEMEEISATGIPEDVQPDDVALIQFSSGSTSEPKGVLLTHRNLTSNCHAINKAASIGETDVSLSWMPLTHDMGLIGFHLSTFTNRAHACFMRPDLFVRRPLLWLELAARVRATLLGSPNFGYRHYLNVLGERMPDTLDLSCVRHIMNGAEPISAALCAEFTARLAPARLSAQAIFPVYGLAEASVAVSFPTPGEPLRTLCVNRHRIAPGEPVELMPKTDASALEFVSEGKVIDYCRLRIAGGDDRPLAEGHVGHVQITGDNVTAGYYDDPKATAAAFTADGWLRTGDLGLCHDGDLFICGRQKEIIFVNGQNFYPHDIEALARSSGETEVRELVAVGIQSRDSTVENLVIFALWKQSLPQFVATAGAIALTIAEKSGLEVAAVVPIKRIPKTTSGKIRRHALRESFLSGEFTETLAQLQALRTAERAGPTTRHTPIETRLLHICHTVIGNTALGVNDNLFEIGINSLKLIAIHEQIDRVYPQRIELAEVFDYPTIAQLAAQIENGTTESAVQLAVAV